MADDHASHLRAFLIVMLILAIVVIILRFWSRAVTATSGRHHKFWWDDWFALLSLPFTLVNISLALYLLTIGLGKDVKEVSTDDQRRILKGFFILYPFYQCSVTFPKVSALLFYTRIFGSASKAFQYALWTTHAVILIWNSAIWIFSILLCNPVQKQWIPSLPGHCYSTGALWLASAIPNLVIDLVILLLPLPMLWGLQMKKSRKAGVIAVFICGYCIVVISIGRLVVVARAEHTLAKNFTLNAVPTIYWTSAEAPVALLGISLPSILFLIRRAVREGPASLFNTRPENTRSRSMLNSRPDLIANRRKSQLEAGSFLRDNEHDRTSYESTKNTLPWNNTLMPLVPSGQEYKVRIMKAISSESLRDMNRSTREHIRVRSEVRVESADLHGHHPTM